MTAKYGANASVWIDAVDASIFFNEAGLDIAVDTAETTTFQAGGWKNYIEGLAGSKATLKGFYDAVNDAAVMGYIMNTGSVLSYGPYGMLAIGDTARLVKVHETGATESSPIGGAVLVNASFTADGQIGFGWTLHPNSTDTGTTTGADRDDGAATTTGWIAHLHVIAVSSGSWVIKLQDAATTDWVDVTGASFTAATGATAQRLTSAAANTTLRRHVRYVATVTGGSTPTITFGLTYSRNR